MCQNLSPVGLLVYKLQLFKGSSGFADFKHGCTDTNHAECSGHPNSAVVPKNSTKLSLADCNLKLREIAEMKISEGSVFTILHEHLLMRKLCSKWMLNLLTVDQK